MKVKALKFTDFMEFHGNGHFSRKKASFTENVTAVKLWIRLVPSHWLLAFSCDFFVYTHYLLMNFIFCLPLTVCIYPEVWVWVLWFHRGIVGSCNPKCEYCGSTEVLSVVTSCKDDVMHIMLFSVVQNVFDLFMFDASHDWCQLHQ